MAFSVSTGLRNHMLAIGSFKLAMDLGYLRLYEGTVPASAEAAVSPTNLLCQITVDAGATRITWETPAVNGIISKAAAETWQGVNSKDGTATFFRIVQPADTDGAVPAELRVQGLVGLVGAELNLSSVLLSLGATQTINHFNVALPTL